MHNWLSSIVGFVVAIGLLTTVHEFGHFIVARFFRVKILRFSVGFGKPLLSWHDKQGTEYAIAGIPLGGYVKMLDESEGIVSPFEKHLAFNNKPVAIRMLVIAAGPIFNLIFAIFAYWLMFIIGISSIAPVVGTVPKGTIADVAGLQRGQEIVAIDDDKVRSWEDVSVALMPHIGENSWVTIKVYDRDQDKHSQHTANLTGWSIDNQDGNMLAALGLEPYDPIPPVIGKILPNQPAADAALLPGDKVIAADSTEIYNRTQLTRLLRDKADIPIIITILRNGEEMTMRVTPRKKLLEGGEEVGYIGIQYQTKAYPKELIRTYRYGPLAALSKSLTKTNDYIKLTIHFVYKMVSGKVSFQHVAGPISIAKYAGETVFSGIEHFLSFLALISISLGILNMLPIPLLDGGHFLFCSFELITGKPVTERIQTLGRTIGFVLLATLMFVALYNDLTRL